MKAIASTLILFLLPTLLFSQNYWQQQVDNKIDVTLNELEKSLDGSIFITYKNNSPDTLSYIWFHLWANAYKNDRTAFSEQFLETGRTDFYFSGDNAKGYVNRLNFSVNGKLAVVEDHPQHQDIVKVVLPEKLAPGKIVKISTGFRVQLPEYFSRSGFKDGAFKVTQWFPKPAVYDKEGWHTMPYLDQGEFYSEFGSYEVNITANEKYIIAATGKLTRTETNLNNTKTYTFYQEKIHDFAWFADKEFKVIKDTIRLGNRIIDAFVYHHTNEKLWEKSMEMLKAAVHTKSSWIGEYPYDVVKVVESRRASDGMEYPTIAIIDNSGGERGVDNLINHEVGHNWFYAILSNNERRWPWMDEGFNTYYDMRYEEEKYGNQKSVLALKPNGFLSRKMPEDESDLLLHLLYALKKDQPISTSSESFTELNYNLIAYVKAGKWLQLIEKRLGKETFDKVMQQYFEAWKFNHPAPGDFRRLAEQVSGIDLSNEFALLGIKGPMLPAQKKQLKLTGFFNLNQTDKYHYISVLPMLGINKYDKLMPGTVVHNYNIPPSKFKFIVAPLYATGTKMFYGIGNLSYTHFIGNNGNRLVLSLSGGRFTTDDYKDSTGTRNAQPTSKIVPAIKYVFFNKNPKSHVQKWVSAKSYFISETGLNFYADTIAHITRIDYPVNKSTIHEFNIGYDYNRALYPHNAILQMQVNKHFARLNFTGNYFFNYAKGGGANLRFFAGKFIYHKGSEGNFYLSRYFINMSGAKGDEDYTYENYFYGRNEFEKFSNRQIMIRDGGFKVRTDLYYNKIGRTDNWLTAINFTSTIPNNINPLAILPVKIPMKVFADAGTFAGAWKQDAGTGKFLYDAGLQLSLLKNTINVYMPLLYSKAYKDYFKSVFGKKIFLNNISFSIDVQNLRLRKLFPQINF